MHIMDPKIVIKFQYASLVLIIPNFPLNVFVPSISGCVNGFCILSFGVTIHWQIGGWLPLGMRFSPLGPIFFNFIQFLGKNGQNKKLAFLTFDVGAPPPPPLVW